MKIRKSIARLALSLTAAAFGATNPTLAEVPQPAQPTSEQKLTLQQTLEEKLALLRDAKNNPVFADDIEIGRFVDAGGTFEYAFIMANQGFDGKFIYRFKQLGLEPKEAITFNDTSKPNAVLIIPHADFFRAFETQESDDFYKKIIKTYDAWVRIASTEGEVYSSIDRIPNIELLVLSGHGTQYSLALGKEDFLIWHEKYFIDTSDLMLGAHLRKLNRNVVIFLDSCMNAKGGKNERNLANVVIRMSRGRTVIAALDSYNSREMKVLSLYPFDVKIIDEPTGEDLTYTNRKVK